MSNRKKFEENLYARVRIRPLIYYASLDKYLDEEWIIQEITKDDFRISNPINGFVFPVGRDSIREWMDNPSDYGGTKRGIIILKVQIELRGVNRILEPLTDSMLTEAMKRKPDQR